MKLCSLLLTLLLLALVPVLFAQDTDDKSGSPPVELQLISGYHNYQVGFSQRAKQIAFQQSKNVSNTRKVMSESEVRKNNPKVYLDDGTLNYQYLNSFINYGEGPVN